jgi:Site-specific recombinase XerD
MPIYKIKGVQRDGKQKYRVVVSYTTSGGEHKKREKAAYGLEEAKAIEALLLNDKKEIPAAKITVGQLANEYLAAQKISVRASTLQNLKSRIDNLILPQLEDIRVDKLSPRRLQKWKEELAEKRTITRCKAGYSVLRAMLNFAVKLEYISKNPLPKVGNFRDAENFEISEDFDFYTEDEFKVFIKVAHDKAVATNKIIDWDYYVFFCVSYFAGTRKGELHALRWSRFSNSMLAIRRSISQKVKDKNGNDFEGPPKNKNSVRDVGIPSLLNTILLDHKERYKSLGEFSEDFFVCGGTRPLRDSTIDRRNRAYAEAANVDRIRIHDFRHSHASLLAHHGVSILEVSRRLGHKNIDETLNTYSHLYPSDKDKAIKALDTVVF